MPATLRVAVKYDSAAFSRLLVEGRRTLAARVTAGMSRAETRAKDLLRGQVRAAGLGDKLANAVRADVYPAGRPTLRPALYVYSKSALLDYFTDGGTIQPGGVLLIPTAEAERRGYAATDQARKGGRVPGNQLRRAARPDLAARDFRLETRLGRGGAVLVIGFPKASRPSQTRKAGAAAGGVVLFVGVRAARVPQLLNLAGERDAIARMVATEINAAVGDNLVS